MKKKDLSQEGLKLIACITMLLDHIGAFLLPQCGWLRIIGRIAFPVYCFLLAEGVHYTKNLLQYGLRLLLCAVVSEIAFDYAVFGGISWEGQSVMLTLLIGFAMAACMKKLENPLLQLLVVVPFAVVAQWARVDYGGLGVVLMALFVLTRETPHKLLIQTVGLAAISYLIDGTVMLFAGVTVRIQLLAIVAMIPIALYSGRKVTNSRAVQLAFYLFYPVHLALLYIVWRFIL